jgi:hypothetical protein
MKIAKAQQADATLKYLFKRIAVIDKGLVIKLIENTICVCKDGQLVIPTPLQVHSVMWYHHYLQHPGHIYLKETINAAMYWKGMHTTIWYKLTRDGNLSMDTFHLRPSYAHHGKVYVSTSLVHA